MKKFLLVILCLFFTWPIFGQAMVLGLLSEQGNVFFINQEAELNISLDTEGQLINAIEGDLVVPNGIEVVKILDSSSVISFWVEKPNKINQNIHFSGITPGGFSGSGKLLRIIVKTQTTGDYDFHFANLLGLLNDGLGTPTSMNSGVVKVSFIAGEPDQSIKVKISDNEPPESFVPIISRLDQIETGIFFLVFDTVDKGTGVDYYEVREGWHSYKRVSSPYRLRNQKLTDDIYVRAVDHEGNERVVKVLAQNIRPWYENVWFYGIILVVFLVLSIVFKIKKPSANAVKNRNKNKF